MNDFLTKVKEGKKPIGTFCETASPYMVECIGYSGFDYVIIDNEHSPIEAETSADMIRAAEHVGVTPIVRIREISRPAVLKVLDVGAKGIIVPNVKTVDEVEELVSYSKYYPVGNRGFCGSRKDGWGFKMDMSVPEMMDCINSDTLLIPQCETREALEVIEDIVSVDGVDGIFIGPFDLSISLGIPGDFSNPIMQDALKTVLDACRRAGKFCILFAANYDAVLSGFAQGFDSMTYSMDAAVFINSAKDQLSRIRENG